MSEWPSGCTSGFGAKGAGFESQPRLFLFAQNLKIFIYRVLNLYGENFQLFLHIQHFFYRFHISTCQIGRDRPCGPLVSIYGIPTVFLSYLLIGISILNNLFFKQMRQLKIYKSTIIDLKILYFKNFKNKRLYVLRCRPYFGHIF